MKNLIRILVILCMVISILTSCSKLNIEVPKADENFIEFDTQEGRFINIDKLLYSLQEGMKVATKSKLLNETKISIDEFKDKKLKTEILSAQNITINKISFKENREYMLSKVKPEGQRTREDVSTVVDIFKLISK